ncbi:MAG: hypothetical protein AAGI07_02675, partial [Bacteroidota bacterium]
MQIKEIENHLEFFKEYLLSNHEIWDVGHLKIFCWPSGSFSIHDSYLDSKGETSELKVRGANLNNISLSLQAIKNLLDKKGVSQWNMVKYTYYKNGDFEYDVFWDQEEEELKNPVIESDKEQENENRQLKEHAEYLNTKTVKWLPSEESLRPWYSIIKPMEDIKTIVKDIIELGCEFEEEDFK